MVVPITLLAHNCPRRRNLFGPGAGIHWRWSNYRSQYPGAVLKDPYTVEFNSDEYFEILRALISLV